jgi:predicted transcriptional regulator
MKHRSRTDIISQLLEAADGGATKTKRMYTPPACLSYAQLTKYLAVTMGNGLVEYVESARLVEYVCGLRPRA